MAGGNGFYFAAAALLTSVVLGLLLYQSRWTASARGGGMSGHEGFAAAKGPPDPFLVFNLSTTGSIFKTISTNFCSLVGQSSTEVYEKAKKMSGYKLPTDRDRAIGICIACGEGVV